MTLEQIYALKGWEPMDTAPKDGTLVLLIVDYSEETNAVAVAEASAEGYLWNPNPLEDARFAPTIGSCNDDNVGPDEAEGFRFAGWCWSQDHWTEGHGRPVLWRPMPELADVETLAGLL